jgi:hypothetical protein
MERHGVSDDLHVRDQQVRRLAGEPADHGQGRGREPEDDPDGDAPGHAQDHGVAQGAVALFGVTRAHRPRDQRLAADAQARHGDGHEPAHVGADAYRIEGAHHDVGRQPARVDHVHEADERSHRLLEQHGQGQDPDRRPHRPARELAGPDGPWLGGGAHMSTRPPSPGGVIRIGACKYRGLRNGGPFSGPPPNGHYYQLTAIRGLTFSRSSYQNRC